MTNPIFPPNNWSEKWDLSCCYHRFFLSALVRWQPPCYALVASSPFYGCQQTVSRLSLGLFSVDISAKLRGNISDFAWQFQ